MALYIYTATLVITVGEVKLIAFLAHLFNHVISVLGVLLKCFLALLKIEVSFAFLGFVQVLPAVLDHYRRVHIQGELDCVHAVEVVKAHVILSVVVLQDHRSFSTTGKVASLRIVGDVPRSHHHRQWVLEAVKLLLDIGRHGEHSDELCA